MSDAYKCDRCGDYKEHEPAFEGETNLRRIGEAGEYDICPECWPDVKPVLNGEPNE